jgi:hypothetical protein
MNERKCYQCGKPGHFAASCPEVRFAAELGTEDSSRPPWCGECDKKTRLLGDIDRPHRCPRCHPEKDLPPQFRVCGCGNVVYRWDRTECGQHQEIGKRTEPKEKEKAK